MVDGLIDSWVSRATRLERCTVPRCWVPHNPVKLSILPGHRACVACGRRDRAHGSATAAATAVGGARAAAWRVHIPVGPLPGLRRRAAGAETLRQARGNDFRSFNFLPSFRSERSYFISVYWS